MSLGPSAEPTLEGYVDPGAIDLEMFFQKEQYFLLERELAKESARIRLSCCLQ